MTPDSISERQWLSQGLREGLLRPDTGVDLMKALDEIHEKLDGTVHEFAVEDLRKNDHL